MDSKRRRLRVLAVNPFHGGSHRQFLEGVVNHSRHDWSLVTGKPVHWKWRMRSAPLELAAAASEAIERDGDPDVVFCSDMLDLPQWRGLLRDARIVQTPTVIYFHENQWTYPVAPGARVDFHFGYTNLLSAIAADACWFNSAFHQRDFLAASETFVRRMPDARDAHDLKGLAAKCSIVPPGFEPRFFKERPATVTPSSPLVLGWVSRWEHDKRPNEFVELVSRLDRLGVPFQLILLGPRPKAGSPALTQLRSEFAEHIRYDAFAPTVDEYWSQLSQIDVVVSTAAHEFFGIAICEAIWAGAIPVLPNRLSYPELVPREFLYDSLDEAAARIDELREPSKRAECIRRCRSAIEDFQLPRIVEQIDDRLHRLS